MNPEASALRVAVDTNVLFSALALPKDSPPFQILELARDGRIEAFVSPFILGELEKNLAAKAGWEQRRLSVLREKLLLFLSLVKPETTVSVISGAVADNRILECAVKARADVLVTGDRKHLLPLGAFSGIPILSPREFLNRYFPDKAPPAQG